MYFFIGQGSLEINLSNLISSYSVGIFVIQTISKVMLVSHIILFAKASKFKIYKSGPSAVYIINNLLTLIALAILENIDPCTKMTLGQCFPVQSSHLVYKK